MNSLNKLKKVASTIDNKSIKQKTCFIVMSFSGNPIIESYYNLGVKPIVEKHNYTCVRIDEIEFTDKITDKIFHYLENSDLIIVDLTEDRPNCYFELGYAVAKQRPFIIQRLDAPNYKAKFEFDVKDYPHIIYKTISDLQEKLDSKLVAI